jgi:hypothetical protein
VKIKSYISKAFIIGSMMLGLVPASIAAQEESNYEMGSWEYSSENNELFSFEVFATTSINDSENRLVISCLPENGRGWSHPDHSIMISSFENGNVPTVKWIKSVKSGVISITTKTGVQTYPAKMTGDSDNNADAISYRYSFDVSPEYNDLIPLHKDPKNQKFLAALISAKSIQFRILDKVFNFSAVGSAKAIRRTYC